MFPSGHARNTTADLIGILQNKFTQLGKIAIKDEAELNEYILF